MSRDLTTGCGATAGRLLVADHRNGQPDDEEPPEGWLKVRPVAVKVSFALIPAWIVLSKAMSDGRSLYLPLTDEPAVVHSHVISVLATSLAVLQRRRAWAWRPRGDRVHTSLCAGDVSNVVMSMGLHQCPD